MLKYISIILIISLLTSCEEDKNIEIENIIGHTFFRIDTINSIKVLKQPCNANIATFRFYKDSIYHNWGQEVERFNIINYFKKEGYYSFTRKFEPKNEIYKIKPIDKEKNYWLINGEVFIDSLYTSKIEKIEQPCIECWDKETCNEYAREERFKKWNLKDKAIKKWRGEYLLYFENESADLRTHVNFKLRIKKDSILFSRQRYSANFDYLCYANQKKDTLFLYYYRTLDEEIKMENYEKYLAKFYINKSKYYIKSNEIDESGKIFEIEKIK